MSLRLVLVRATIRNHGLGLRISSPSVRSLNLTQSQPLFKSLHEAARLTLRRASTKAAPKSKAPTTPEPRKYLYPENFVIYHAGTGRTTFIACLKLATIFVFLFFGVIAMPNYIAASQPPLHTAGIALCGVIPVAAVAYITSPFVASVSIRLPVFARQSKELLERWARKGVPADTPLFITTLSFIGKPRVSTMTVADLAPAKQRFGLVNFVRDVEAENAKRSWWMFRAVGKFNVTPGGENRVKGGFVWPEVEKAIQGNTAGTSKI